MEKPTKPKPAQVSLAEEITEVGRELGLRHGAYPKFVTQGRLSQADADHYINTLYSAKRRLEALNYLIVGLTDAQWGILEALQAALPDPQRKTLEFLLNQPITEAVPITQS
ncbi:hypothetical protein [Spirosoma sordidisoli]|uniref:Uncharacterized protein n=1 Tax=Spirosoma sordidisoli TaxID=2502893 RepID=A0A4Q2UG23_9BACT|nr:hypothetical protein [Spirosoma sordidisoli]RYC66321.1 hypothetical protein EQG79_30055 [Spirosoma sordidisoli]